MQKLREVAPPHRAAARRDVEARRARRARRQARPLRGRAGHAPRHRPRHVSVRHVVARDGGRRVRGHGRRALAHRLRGRPREGVLHARRRRAVPDRARRTTIGERLRKRGDEFGSVTGRPRRTGWLDLPALRYAVRVNGLDGLALTKLDVLTGLDEVKVCTAYRTPTGTSPDFPIDDARARGAGLRVAARVERGSLVARERSRPCPRRRGATSRASSARRSARWCSSASDPGATRPSRSRIRSRSIPSAIVDHAREITGGRRSGGEPLANPALPVSRLAAARRFGRTGADVPARFLLGGSGLDGLTRPSCRFGSRGRVVTSRISSATARGVVVHRHVSGAFEDDPLGGRQEATPSLGVAAHRQQPVLAAPHDRGSGRPTRRRDRAPARREAAAARRGTRRSGSGARMRKLACSGVSWSGTRHDLRAARAAARAPMRPRMGASGPPMRTSRPICLNVRRSRRSSTLPRSQPPPGEIATVDSARPRRASSRANHPPSELPAMCTRPIPARRARPRRCRPTRRCCAGTRPEWPRRPCARGRSPRAPRAGARAPEGPGARLRRRARRGEGEEEAPPSRHGVEWRVPRSLGGVPRNGIIPTI